MKTTNYRILLVLTLLALAGQILPRCASAQGGSTEPWQALPRREFGTATNELAAIEKEIQGAKPEQYPAIETKLIAVLETPDATMPGRQFACQMLKLVGSAKCVPAVSKLLTDDQLSHMARSVLVGLSGPAADEALRKALQPTQGKLRIGVINTLGDRRDTGSLRVLASFLSGNDDPTVRATFNAIGKIGDAAAADVLDRSKASADPAREYWAHAYFRCAESLTVAGDAKRSLKMYQTLYDGSYPPSVRAGAFPALVKAEKEKAVPQILKLLGSDNAIMNRAGVSAAISVPGPAATKALVQALPALPQETQIVLLGALAARGDPEISSGSVSQLAASGPEEVRRAAIRALGRIGKDSSIPALTAAVKEGEPFAKEATTSMIELQGEGVTEALIKQSSSGDAAVRQVVFNVLAQRGKPEALPALRQALNDNDPAIRRAGLKALAVVGTGEDLPRLGGVLLASKDNAEQEQVAQTMSAIIGRLKDKTDGGNPVLEALARADAQAKVNLLAVLPVIGGDKALKASRDCLSGEGDVRKAAIRTLADWPDSAPMPDLLAMAKNDPDQASRVLALRGYIRLVGLSNESAAAKTELSQAALALATRPEEKKLVLTGLSNVNHPGALKLVGSLLDNPDLKQEAYLAYEKIAEALIAQEPAAAKEALQRVADGASDNRLKNRAKRALERINK